MHHIQKLNFRLEKKDIKIKLYTPENKHRHALENINYLENYYLKNSRPNKLIIDEIATIIDLSPRKVQVWFQNRRAKEKKLFNSIEKSSLNFRFENYDALEASRYNPNPIDVTTNRNQKIETSTVHSYTNSPEDIYRMVDKDNFECRPIIASKEPIRYHKRRVSFSIKSLLS
ncbi:homeobox-domain-containing protein [Neoconidiobolus thromboides FSU 785]|nr:homeobox-domain-containing protein [Neoconidiobolus thromboides FSU 785]